MIMPKRFVTVIVSPSSVAQILAAGSAVLAVLDSRSLSKQF